MTEKRRLEIAREFRKKLDRNILRKNAIEQICEDHGIDRSTLYRLCKRFGVRTA